MTCHFLRHKDSKNYRNQWRPTYVTIGTYKYLVKIVPSSLMFFFVFPVCESVRK